MVENLKIDPLIDISNVSTHPDPILRAIETYKNHSSIIMSLLSLRFLRASITLFLLWIR